MPLAVLSLESTIKTISVITPKSSQVLIFIQEIDGSGKGVLRQEGLEEERNSNLQDVSGALGHLLTS